jgi:hypothetical protein
MAGLPAIGTLYNKGLVNGLLVWTQPGGPGSIVQPQPPQVNPPPNWKNSNWLPAFPYTYQGLLNWGCGHWTNTAEIYTEFDDATDQVATLVCCPVCTYVQQIIEPATEWWQEYFSRWPVGIVQPGGGLIPNEN